MSAKIRSMLVLAAMVAIGWFAAMQTTSNGQFPSAAGKVPQWEYKVDQSPVEDTKLANGLGREGWELVAIDRGVNKVRAIYKRRIG